MNKLNPAVLLTVIIAFSISACRKSDSIYFEYRADELKVKCNTVCNPVGYYSIDKDVNTG